MTKSECHWFIRWSRWGWLRQKMLSFVAFTHLHFHDQRLSLLSRLNVKMFFLTDWVAKVSRRESQQERKQSRVTIVETQFHCRTSIKTWIRSSLIFDFDRRRSRMIDPLKELSLGLNMRCWAFQSMIGYDQMSSHSGGSSPSLVWIHCKWSWMLILIFISVQIQTIIDLF